MEICLDATSLNFIFSGIGNYTFNLYKALIRNNKNFEFSFLFLNDQILNLEAKEFFDSTNNYYLNKYDVMFFRNMNSFIPMGKRIFYFADKILSKTKKPLIAKNASILHSQDLLFNFFPQKKNVVTVYDLTTERKTYL